MSETIQQADELRSRAIGLLLAERTAIDERLRLFGHDGATPIQSKLKACRTCGDYSHNARTCPQKNTGTEVPATQSA